MMSEAELAAIEARANAAQRGPWRPDIDGPGMVYAGALNWQDTGGNADFIAHARIDVPALISHRLTLDEVNHGFELMEAQDGIRSVITFT